MKNKWFEGLYSLLIPTYCLVCENKITAQQNYICLDCLSELPVTNHHKVNNNLLEQLFWGKFPIERAASYFYFIKGCNYEKIIYKIKYRQGQEVAKSIGHAMAKQMNTSGFFDTIDFIVPVPLHKIREKERGYNQSEWLAKGISEVTGIPVQKTIVSRIIQTSTQTRKSSNDRWENVKDIFSVNHSENLNHKHILLVDDVITTGATITSCAITIQEKADVKISVCALSSII